MIGLLYDLGLIVVGFFGGYYLQLKLPGLHADIIAKGKMLAKKVVNFFSR